LATSALEIVEKSERINRGENVRLDPEIIDGIRKIRERKAREAKWGSDPA